MSVASYLDSNFLDVYISSSALLSILGPIIENYQKETGGILIGSLDREWIDGKNRPIVKVHSAFPSITAKATGRMWEPNIPAIKRLKGFARAYSLEILGEYHSHPRGPPELSDDDKAYIYERHAKKMAATKAYILLANYDPDLEGELFLSWIELVVKVVKKGYANTQKPSGEFWSPNNSNKLRAIIKLGDKQGFDVTLAAYAFLANPDTEDNYFDEIGVYTEISSSYEK
ncbi:MAG: Mov34/MPN/PAD-1 family protein [Candidatus Heimdallarchaeota archaeon]|nr:Mov34/MPN/PAD-1 family protein [Candidatus Heimdallarchaeota archaeon]